MEWMLMPLKRYADFSGRSRRKEYWMFTLLLILAYLAFLVLLMTMGASAIGLLGTGGAAGAGAIGGGVMVLLGLFGIFVLGIFIPSLAVAVRRLHDTDRSGWWVLAPMAASLVSVIVPGGALAALFSVASLILSVALIVFYCLDGTPGPNRFGPNPKDPAGSADLNEVFR